MTSARSLNKTGFWLSVVGAIFGFMVLFGAGMSNTNAKGGLPIAFVIPAIAIMFSVRALEVARRQGNLRDCRRLAIWNFVISGGTILLTIAAIRSYP